MIGHLNEVEKSFMPTNLSLVALASIEGILQLTKQILHLCLG